MNPETPEQKDLVLLQNIELLFQEIGESLAAEAQKSPQAKVDLQQLDLIKEQLKGRIKGGSREPLELSALKGLEVSSELQTIILRKLGILGDSEKLGNLDQSYLRLNLDEDETGPMKTQREGMAEKFKGQMAGTELQFTPTRPGLERILVGTKYNDRGDVSQNDLSVTLAYKGTERV